MSSNQILVRSTGLPPLDGSMLLPEIVDFNMQSHPDRVMYVYVEDGLTKEVTYLEFGRACHRVAHIFRPGREGILGKVVACVLLADTMLQHAITVGVMMAGLVVSEQSYGSVLKFYSRFFAAVSDVAS